MCLRRLNLRGFRKRQAGLQRPRFESPPEAWLRLKPWDLETPRRNLVLSMQVRHWRMLLRSPRALPKS
jgi:hypothetical protein